MKKLLYSILLLPALVSGQTQIQNYTKVTQHRDSLPNGATNISVVYYDGLGRPIQQIANKQSNQGKNIVTHIEYDQFGRQTRDYLPFANQATDLEFDLSARDNTDQFYLNYSSPTAYPYSEKFLEASPHNTLLKQAAPGETWAGDPESDNDHAIKFVHSTNDSLEVKRFSVLLGTNTQSLADNGFYEKEQLYKTITKDENWISGVNNTTEEFKDKSGRVILKRTYCDGVKHDTYYVYDVYGNLTYVIPPLVSDVATQLNTLCYQYKYDGRNRLVEKKLPGRDWEFIVYDNLDRVALTGPALSPFGTPATGWLFTKYDAHGRIAYTGWYTGYGVSSQTRATLAEEVAGLGTYEIKYPTAQTSPDPHMLINYYENKQVFPLGNYYVLSIQYYDDYKFNTPPSSYTTAETTGWTKIFYNNATRRPVGLPTGSWLRIPTNVNEALGNRKNMLYDSKGREVRVNTLNYLGGTSKFRTTYDFSSKVTFTWREHKRLASDGAFVVQEFFTYTPEDRLLDHKHKIRNRADELLSHNEYDALGQ
ncbi:MAG TPA: DUF6443 domain-containing protein, partial [Flavobacterium sp.]